MTLRETVDTADNNSISTLLVADYIDRNFLIDTIEPLIFQESELIAPFHNFDAKTLYFGIQIEVTGRDLISVSFGKAAFLNEVSVEKIKYVNAAILYDGLATNQQVSLNPILIQNLWFFKTTFTLYTDINFIGYKVTLK